MARRFFRLASTKAIEETNKREIEEGKEVSRSRLRRERDEAKAAGREGRRRIWRSWRPG
jgi:hypothetical protein